MPFGKGLPKLLPSFSYQPVRALEELVGQFERKVVVDLGAGGRRVMPWVKTVDSVRTPGTDYVCDFVKGRTPFEDESVDLVISTGVLEHVEDERSFMEEIRRILKPGGTIHIEVPFLQQYHEDPIDCRRFTLPGLKMFLQRWGFDVVKDGVHLGPTVTILTLTAYYIDLIFNGRSYLNKLLATAAFGCFSVLFWPLRYLDFWLVRRPNAHRLAFGVYASALKR
jgi:SAM-dependent methyltransferase